MPTKHSGSILLIELCPAGEGQLGRQAVLAPHVCRFYAGEMLMGLLALSAALAALASATRWSFAVFLALQGALAWAWTLTLRVRVNMHLL